MNKKYIIRLTPEERTELEQMTKVGKAAARKLLHARVLLKADVNGPNWTDKQISEAMDVGTATIERVRRAFVEESLKAALERKRPRTKPPRKLDGEQEAHLIALSCSSAPEGYKRWSLRLLADKMVELEYVDSLSYETVRQVLKKTRSSPG